MKTTEKNFHQAHTVTRADIYCAAWIAAEEALPKESRQLIQTHDLLHDAWGLAGWTTPTPENLRSAATAVQNDPLASIAFELRRKTNEERHKEWLSRNPPNQPKPQELTPTP